MANDDGKTATIAALDEKAFGAEARASRKEMFERKEQGDNLGAAAAAVKSAYEGIKHGLSHPVDSTIGQIELARTPSAARNEYLANEKNR